MMKRVAQVLRALISRKWWWVTILVLLGMALFLRLSKWQFDRLQQRRAANAVLAETLAAPPFALTAVSLPPDPETLQNREVTVHGTYDLDNQLGLKIQNWNGRAGIHLIAPLVFPDGETAVLVDRGWIPDSEAAVAQWTQFDETEPLTVTGYVALSQTISRLSAEEAIPDEPQKEWYRVDVAAIQAQMPYELLPVYVVQSPPPEGDTEPPFHAAREVDLSEGPHLSYAIQWILFALVLGGGYVVFVDKSVSKIHAEEVDETS
ncbi:MAG: SURF1 family protein [Anaerolineales bacterium]|nr:SURF1 family protein [Anaerolineales bacterium]